LALVR